MDMQSISNYHGEFLHLAPKMTGAHLPWLHELRLAALEQFEQTGFPTTRLEDWKYTNVAPLARKAFRFSASADAARSLPALPIGNDDDRIVFINGHYAHELSRLHALPNGAVIASMPNALQSHAGQLKDMLHATTGDGCLTLNAAFWNDGVYIELPDGAVPERPVHLVFFCSEADLACNIFNVIRIGANARLTLVEHYLGVEDIAYFTNVRTLIDCADGASIEHLKVQEESPRAFHIANIDVQQQKNSRFSSHSFALGGSLSRTAIAMRFAGEACQANMNGLYVLNGRQHADHHIRIDHQQPRGVSKQHYKGVLNDASHGVFSSKVVVHPDAQQSDARQTNRNLLLSRDAEVDTRPQLDIRADDVKCSHGATVGQLDEDQVFYLRSRGMDDATARNVLTYAFAEDIVAQVRIESLRRWLEQSLRRKLPG
jgi:Fe-S cluster assembly protein SufD